MKSKLDVEIDFLNEEIGNPRTPFIRSHLFAARDALLFAKGEEKNAWWRQ